MPLPWPIRLTRRLRGFSGAHRQAVPQARTPLAAVLLGSLLAAPQFFFNRAYYLRHRENEAAITPQLILSEDELPNNWEAFSFAR